MSHPNDQLALEAFEYAMSTLLRAKDDQPLAKALKPICTNGIFDLLALSYDDLDALEYKDSNGNLQTVPLPARNLVRALIDFCITRAADGKPIALEEWTGVNVKEFDGFLLHEYPLVLATVCLTGTATTGRTHCMLTRGSELSSKLQDDKQHANQSNECPPPETSNVKPVADTTDGPAPAFVPLLSTHRMGRAGDPPTSAEEASSVVEDSSIDGNSMAGNTTMAYSTQPVDAPEC